VVLRWDEGFIGRVTVRNTGPVTADWSVVLGLDDGVRVRRFWVQGRGSASGRQDDTTVRFSGRLAAGASIVVDYQAQRSRDASSEPRSCTINGAPCR
jgi:hypothetical protein